MAANAKREREAAAGAPWRRGGSAAMAAVPQNNLREQLRLHSARGALRAAPPPARDRPP